MIFVNTRVAETLAGIPAASEPLACKLFATLPVTVEVADTTTPLRRP